MKNIFTKIKLTLIAMLFAFAAKAQTTCSTSVFLEYPITGSVSSYTAGTYWFNVTLDSGIHQIKITSPTGANKIDSVVAYTGSCGSLTQIQKDTVSDSTNTLLITLYDSTATFHYFKLSNTGNTTFSVTATPQCYIVGDMGYCPGQELHLVAYGIGGTGGPYTYSWTAPGSTIIGSSTTSSITILPTATSPTTYTLHFTSASFSATPTATIYPLPAANCKNCELVTNGAFELFQNERTIFSNVYYPGGASCAPGGWWGGNSGMGTELSDPKIWIGATNCTTPDYFNANYPATNPYQAVSVPTNYVSHGPAIPGVPAHSGGGYGGFFTLSILLQNQREYLQNQLKCPLVAGQLYNVSFYTAAANWNRTIPPPPVSNNIGAYISVATPTNITTGSVLNYTPQINATNIVTTATTSGTWTQVAGTIVGNGEKYITLGNFYDNAHTQIQNFVYGDDLSEFTASYYYIDDISITPVPLGLSATTCQSGSVTISAYGAPSSTLTTWAGPGSYTATGASISIPSPTVATTYTCTVNLLANCSGCLDAPPFYTVTTPYGSPTIPCMNCTSATQTITINPQTPCSATHTLTTPTVSGTFTTSPAYMPSSITINDGISYTISCTDLRMAATTSITVASGGTLTIAGSWIHACDECSSTSMWQGISVNGEGTLIITTGGVENALTYNIIEDAVQAVATAGCSSRCFVPNWSIGSVIFNKNATAIYIGGNVGDLSANLIGNNIDCGVMFTCRNLKNHSVTAANISAIFTDVAAVTPLHPSFTNPTCLTIAGHRSANGVFVDNINLNNATNPAVTIGSKTVATNVFDNVDIGIRMPVSSVTAKNNTFQNLTGNLNDMSGIGILGDATITGGGASNILIAGNSSSTIVSGEGNKFLNCLSGVYTIKMKNVYVNNNLFDNETTNTSWTGTGNHLTGYWGCFNTGFGTSANSGDVENFQFTNNSSQNYDGACYVNLIKLFNTASAGSLISGNTLTSAGLSNRFANYGVYLQSSSVAPASGVPIDAFSITTNTITNVGISCIYLTAVNSATATTGFVQIYNNGELSIKYNMAATSLQSPPLASINLVTSPRTRVTFNTQIYVTGYGPQGFSTAVPAARYHAGIYNTTSTNCTINCNTVSNTGECFVFSGNCAATGNNWQSNFINYSQYGLVLRSGILGDQGNSSYGIANNFNDHTHFTAQTITENINPASGTTSKLYTYTSSCGYQPCANANVIGGAAYSTTLGSLLAATAGSNTLIAHCGDAGTGDRMANNQSVSGDATNSDSLFYLNMLSTIADTSYTYPLYDGETRWSLQYLVSSNLPDLPAAKGYQNAKTFALIDGAISNGDYGAAQTLLNAINPTNTVESNWQTVDNITIKLQTDTLTSNDISSLQSIAAQCPFTGGSIVHNARGLLNIHFGDFATYPDNCPLNDGGIDRVQQTASISTNVANKNQLNLYPNPSNGKLYISNFNANEKTAYIEVTDITGKLITKQQSAINNNVVELNLDVNNGVYFVKVVGANGNIQVQKIIINK